MSARLCAFWLVVCLAGIDAIAQQTTAVIIETDLGSIEVAIDTARAPLTAANFLKYVDAGLYDGGRFHRAVRQDNQVRSDVKIEVIQGGRSPDSVKQQRGFGPIPLERTSVTGLRHVDGAISMARGNTADPHRRISSSASGINRRSILAAPAPPMVRVSPRSAVS